MTKTTKKKKAMALHGSTTKKSKSAFLKKLNDANSRKVQQKRDSTSVPKREIDQRSSGRKNPGAQAPEVAIGTVDAFNCDVKIDDRIKVLRIDDEQPCFENSPEEEEEEEGKVQGMHG